MGTTLVLSTMPLLANSEDGPGPGLLGFPEVAEALALTGCVGLVASPPWAHFLPRGPPQPSLHPQLRACTCNVIGMQ